MSTVATALARIANLTPTYPQTSSPSRLKGEGVWVLSYAYGNEAHPLPTDLADAQRRRTASYMAGGTRTDVPEAPRYVVWSYDEPIAWVTLDGRTHFPLLSRIDPSRRVHIRTMQRQQDAIRASWPESFGIDRDGEPSYRVPGGKRMQEDGSLIPA